MIFSSEAASYRLFFILTSLIRRRYHFCSGGSMALRLKGEQWPLKKAISYPYFLPRPTI
ncbi:MAG: hypothetical protein GTO16_03340 [Candidatus Aminicenantes bacterium]|nr:hypothetical protein [Candidatus Aminicenantes bacterium]